MNATTSPTYEEQFAPGLRRALRFYRPLRRLARRAAGKPCNVLLEVRWRLGDEVMAIPIYEEIRAKYGDCRTTVLCNYPELLEGNPFVDAVNNASCDPDVYVCLRSGPRLVNRVEHYARCAGVPMPNRRPALYYSNWSSRFVSESDSPFVTVCSGASWPNKRWNIGRWRSVCSALLELGYGIVELGVGDESIGVGMNLVGSTNVREAACVLKASRLFICCDSGLMHLALAAGTRVLALFGPTDPDILIRNEPLLMPLVVERECSGCWNRTGGSEQPGTCRMSRTSCLDAVSADEVLAQAQRVLEAEA